MENQTPNTVATTPAPQPTPVAAPVVPVAPATPASAPVQSPSTDVLGIISIVMFFIGLSAIGLVLGLIGMSSAKKNGRPTTLSKIGTILCAIGVALFILFVIFVFLGNMARRSG